MSRIALIYMYSLGCLLESCDGSDVVFSVGGETFRAHRAVLRAVLLGSMAEATTPGHRHAARQRAGDVRGHVAVHVHRRAARGARQRGPSVSFFLDS